MAAGQFIRFGNFAHTLKRGKKASAQAVIAEALRQPGSSDHVARNYGQVLEPRVFRGSEQSVLSAIEISTATRTNAVGHRIRRDSPVLCGVIASYPRRINPAKRGEMDFFDDAEEMRNYEWWRQRALAWFDDIYGSRLRLVVGSIQKWMLEHIRQKGIKRILDEIHACCREQGIRAPDPDAIIASIQTDLVLALG